MSEYTDYYAVRSSNKFDVQKKLNEAKIYSIVDADEDQYWFMDEFKTNYFKESYTELLFDDDKEYSFSDEEKKTLSNFFGKEFDQLKPYLKYGKGGEFLNDSGIPYWEMLDQNLLDKNMFEFEDGYCLLAEDLVD